MEWSKKVLLAVICAVIAGLAGAQSMISGTVFSPAGGDVYGTYVIACYPDANQDCDESLTSFVQLSQGGPSAPFEIRHLGSGPYAILAWQDSNKNGEIDDGEPITFYSGDGGEPIMVTPPAQGLDLRFGVGAVTEENFGGTISGTITAPRDLDLAGTYVFVCVLTDDGCDEARDSSIQQLSQAGSSAPFEARGLASGAYTVIAWKDVNGNGEIDDVDYFAFYTKDAVTPQTVTPPATDLTLTLGHAPPARRLPARHSSKAS